MKRVRGKFYFNFHTPSLFSGMKIKKVLIRKKTETGQSLLVLDSYDFGKILVIDGIIQVTSKDDFFYSESLGIVPLLTHPQPQKILILGGGDGGVLEKVLRSPLVKNIVLVELDKEVIKISQRYFKKEICGNSFKDPRLNLMIGDGKEYIEKKKEKFDLIISDLTDCFGPAKYLFTREFFQKIKKHLRKNGLFALQSDAPLLFPKISSTIYKTLKIVFSYVFPYAVFIPSYGFEQSFILASDFYHPLKIKKERIKNRFIKNQLSNLNLLTPSFYFSLFNLPLTFKKVFQARVKISTDKSPFDAKKIYPEAFLPNYLIDFDKNAKIEIL